MPILKFEGMQHHANESTTIKSSRFSVGFQEIGRLGAAFFMYD